MEKVVMPLKAVNPSLLEKTLFDLWESVKATSKIRSCLFNLVLFIQDGSRLDYYRNIASKVMNFFPCRVIFIAAITSDKEDQLETSVDVLFPKVYGGFVACDYIHIEAAGKAIEKVPSVTIPHLVPDLPVFLLWGGSPVRNSGACLELEKVATRIIFDSESCDELMPFIDYLLYHFEKENFEIADLNWARIESWRDCIGNAFALQDKQDLLYNLKTLTITYNKASSSFFKKDKIQALLLQAWLASQLKWKLQSLEEKDTGFLLRYLRGTKTILVYLKAEEVLDLWTGALLQVEFHSSDERSFSFSRTTTRPQEVCLQYSSKTECYLPYHILFTKTDSGQSLVREICHKETSPHYIQALKQLTTLKNFAIL